MEKLLIVEDEKMIRLGLRKMAERAGVPIGEILECKNGEEALALLAHTPVEVMFTDVRMPRMDGIALVKRLSTLAQPPLTVIISGYDEFTYAVEALRCGAREYLLKPVTREAIAQVLAQLEEELTAGKTARLQPLKYVLLHPEASREEWEAARTLFTRLLGTGPYRVAVGRLSGPPPPGVLLLEHMWDGVQVMVGEAANLTGTCLGLSEEVWDFTAFLPACLQARDRFRLAFLTGAQRVEEQVPPSPVPSPQDCDRLVQMLGTRSPQEIREALVSLLAPGQEGKWTGEQFLSLVTALLTGAERKCPFLSPWDTCGLRLRQPFSYPSFSQYREQLLEALLGIHRHLEEKNGLPRNLKMEEALAYMGENYKKNLNMATVSNHISVSYSFFSQAFKEYTGINFLLYLKTLRIHRAQELLTTTTLPIAAIATQVGFEDEKHFMKVFRTLVGISPTQYRSLHPRPQETSD